MFDKQQIQSKLAQVAVSEMDLEAGAARDVAFHMTDWLEDLSAFTEFCRDPESLTNEQVGRLLLAFLVHVPNHVAAAAKLYGDFPVQDVFGVGAVSLSRDAGA
jgi:hypothetical protein